MDVQGLEVFNRQQYIADVRRAAVGRTMRRIEAAVRDVVRNYMRRCTCYITNQEQELFAIKEIDGGWKFQPIRGFITKMGTVELRARVQDDDGNVDMSDLSVDYKFIKAAWSSDDMRTEAAGMDFMPPTNVHAVQAVHANKFNTYCGPGISRERAIEEGIQGSPAQLAFERYLREDVCNNEPETYQFAASWLAHQVQRPGVKTRTALVLTGRKGAGKSTICELLMEIVGQKNCIKLKKTEQMTGKFNAAVVSKVVVMCDDIHWQGNQEEATALKPLITDAWTTFEPKGKDPYQIKLISNVLFISNNAAVSIGEQERRFCVAKSAETGSLRTPEQIRDFRQLLGLDFNGAAGDAQGLLDVARWLYEFDISGWTQVIPKSGEGLEEQVGHTLRGLDAWWHALLDSCDPRIWGPTSEQARGGDIWVRVSTLKQELEKIRGLHANELTLAKIKMFLRKVMRNCDTNGEKHTFGKADQQRGYRFIPWREAVQEFGALHNLHEWAAQLIARGDAENQKEDKEFDHPGGQAADSEQTTD
jgi:hypothetical protein